MSTVCIVGVDPHPNGGHFVVSEWIIAEGEDPQLVFAAQAEPWTEPGATYVVEDPRGVLFNRTSSLLWSQTNFSAGEIRERFDAEMVSPAEARKSLVKMAGATGVPTKDGHIKELLELIFGVDAFSKGKVCSRRKAKSHGPDCPKCHGTTWESPPGKLHEISNPHFRDAFVVAQYVAMRLAGGE